MTEIGVSGDTIMLVVFVTFLLEDRNFEEQVILTEEKIRVYAVFRGEYGVKFCSV